MKRLGLLLALALAIGCERKQEPQPQVDARGELDAGALRASAVEGLEAAARDPVIASKLALAGALEQPDIETAIERMLARLGADPTASGAADRFFAEVQEGPAMRATLAEFARQNPELDLSALTEGFVAHVDERLTRPGITAAIEAVLRVELRSADAALARALMIEAEGAQVLAAAILGSFADAQVRAELEGRLGKDPAALQARLERRLADPGRLAYLITQLGEQARAPEGIAAIVEILDHPSTATLLGGALARALDDEAVRERCEGLFGLALAEELDTAALERDLRRLLDEPAIVREAAGLLAALGREDYVRERVARIAGAVAEGPGFSERLLDAID
ncbi:MAG: hypothetical protein R6X02_19165 [Enhygromyxa sp.]